MTNNFISNETPIVGKLSIISMKGCEGITAKIDEYLRAFRGTAIVAAMIASSF